MRSQGLLRDRTLSQSGGDGDSVARGVVWLALILLSALPAPTSAEIEGATTHSLSRVAWIAGSWIGGDGDTFIEERWSRPAGNEMIGTFRMLEGGQPVFYEFMRLAREPEGIVLRIKHFGADLTAWEDASETVVFELEQITDSQAVFVTLEDGQRETLTYRRTDEGLELVLDKPAKGSSSTFVFRRD